TEQEPVHIYYVEGNVTYNITEGVGLPGSATPDLPNPAVIDLIEQDPPPGHDPTAPEVTGPIPLTFQIVEGDLVLIEPGQPDPVCWSDVIRFRNDATGHGFVIIISDPPNERCLNTADIPGGLHPNTVQMNEAPDPGPTIYYVEGNVTYRLVEAAT